MNNIEEMLFLFDEISKVSDNNEEIDAYQEALKIKEQYNLTVEIYKAD